MTSQGTPSGIANRALADALQRRDLDLALACSKDLGSINLESATRLLHLMALKRSPMFSAAARRWLTRFVAERKPAPDQIATVADAIAELPHDPQEAAEVLLAAVQGRS